MKYHIHNTNFRTIVFNSIYIGSANNIGLSSTIRGKILEEENFGKSMILKLLARKNLVNLPAVDQKILLVNRLEASAFCFFAQQLLRVRSRYMYCHNPCMSWHFFLTFACYTCGMCMLYTCTI